MRGRVIRFRHIATTISFWIVKCISTKPQKSRPNQIHLCQTNPRRIVNISSRNNAAKMSTCNQSWEGASVHTPHGRLSVFTDSLEKQRLEPTLQCTNVTSGGVVRSLKKGQRWTSTQTGGRPACSTRSEVDLRNGNITPLKLERVERLHLPDHARSDTLAAADVSALALGSAVEASLPLKSIVTQWSWGFTAGNVFSFLDEAESMLSDRRNSPCNALVALLYWGFAPSPPIKLLCNDLRPVPKEDVRRIPVNVGADFLFALTGLSNCFASVVGDIIILSSAATPRTARRNDDEFRIIAKRALLRSSSRVIGAPAAVGKFPPKNERNEKQLVQVIRYLESSIESRTRRIHLCLRQSVFWLSGLPFK